MTASERQLNALIVDDDADAAEYLSELLRSIGVTPHVARRVRQLKSALRNKPDVVFLDMMLPEKDGVQIIEALSKGNLDASVVVVSACSDRILHGAESFARMSGLKALGHIRKPVWKEDLEKVCRPLLKRGGDEVELEEKEFLELANSGKLINQYQPIVDAKQAIVSGLVANVQLNHPRLGPTSPTGMWDTAEAYAAEDALQKMSLQNVMQEAQAFMREGFHLKLTTEVSAKRLGDPTFTDYLIDLGRKAGILPSNICLSITETELRRNLVPCLGSMVRLGMRGSQFAVEDYGKGSLSGGMLAWLPVDYLRIDRSLVSATLRDGDARNRIIDIVEFASRQDLQLVATGVNSEAHLGLLLDLGINFFQGRVFTKPRPFQEMVFWLKDSAYRLGELGLVSQLRPSSKRKA